MELILARHIIVTMGSQAHQAIDHNFVRQTALFVGLCEIAVAGEISYSNGALGPRFCQHKVLVFVGGPVFEGDRDCLCREESQTPSPNTTGYRNSPGASAPKKSARFAREEPRGPFVFIGHDWPVPVAAGVLVEFVVGVAIA